MQFKPFALLAIAASVAHAQTVSFNASQIIQDLEDLTNLADVTNSLAGTITAGNALSTLPGLVTDLTTYASALVTDAVTIATDASGSVFDTTDQIAICTSLNQFIAADQALVASIASKSNIISISPLDTVITTLLNNVQSCANGIVANVTPAVPTCVGTGNV